MLNWLTKNKFQAHLTAFLLMVISSIGMLFLMRQNNDGFTWLMVAIFVVANIIAIFVK